MAEPPMETLFMISLKGEKDGRGFSGAPTTVETMLSEV